MHVGGVSQVAGGKEHVYQFGRYKRHGFDPWVGKIPWRRKWQLLQYSCLEKSHRQRSLEGYSPWGRQESQTTEHSGTSGTSELWEQVELALNPLLIYTRVTLD